MSTPEVIGFIFVSLAFTVAFRWVAKRAQSSDKRWVREMFGGGARRSVRRNHYTTLRDHALNVLPYMVGAGIDLPDDHVYGLVVEWPLNGSVLTVTAFQNGDSSLYLSSGQIHVGGAGKEAIANAAKRLVDEGRQFHGRALRTTDISFPVAGWWSFYLHTVNGRLKHTEPELKLQSGASPWARVYSAAHELITQWRLQEQRER